MPTIDFQELLNAEQLAAATAPDGPILVLAAAGTGKTRTLVFRVAQLVERGIAPDRILLLTFTNKAAREMLDRAREVVGEGVGGVWGGTFHHLANRLLRRHAPRVGFASDFTILDRDDSRALVSQCVKDLKLEHKEFPRSAVLLGLFSMAANAEADIAELAGRRVPETDPEAIRRVHAAYEKRKQDMGGMDFDDLLVNGLRLLRDHADIRERYQEQFRHVLVDEYQDTNPIQAELVDRLGAKHGNVFVVGDDFQSIYAWRGADYRNIMTFPDRYRGTQIYRLETNYRSVPNILAVANACIAGNPEQFQKVLRATREPGDHPVVAHLRDGDEQARYVVEQVRLLRREGFRLSDIAVLYRAHFHALELERLLPMARVPYVITSGMRFFEQAHIKDVLCLLRVLVFPNDELSFTRLLGLLPGVGPRTAVKAWAKVGSRFRAQDAGQREVLRGALGKAAQGAWARVEAVLDAASEGVSADDLLDRFMETFYGEHLQNAYENADERMEDIAALTADVARYTDLEEFLSGVALLTNVDGDDAPEEEGGGQESLRLSTVHQAKGLEWGAVIILWVTEGMFPSSRSLNESMEGEAEERRLFYVAVTRAKDALRICVPEVRRSRDGGVFYCSPSRFVTEIPPHFLRVERNTGFM
ncbi:MAG: ATP-dependent helicase [Lentisphaerae bacterium]|nr:ATP-dependent helicase [Lentisphaerota bacterium]